MKARLILRHKLTDIDGDLKELVVWRVPIDENHPEGVRYRMAFIPRGYGKPAVLYDNHHPRGHHRHIRGRIESCDFLGIQQLIVDFENDVAKWKQSRGRLK